MQNATYYVHHRDYDYGLGNTYNGSNIRYTVSTTSNPFAGAYTKTFTKGSDTVNSAISTAVKNKLNELPNNYTGYFYSITARYGENIADQWPVVTWMENHGVDPMGSNDSYKFRSWIRQNGSNTEHIKGKYAAMSYELITDKGKITATADNDSTGNIPTHILEARYGGATPKLYRYYIYLGTAPGDYPDTASEMQIAHSDSTVQYQVPVAFTGYDLVRQNPTTGNGSSTTWTNISYYYDPHGNAVTLKHGAEELTGIQKQKRDADDNLMFNNEGKPVYENWTNGSTCYYDQSLNFIGDVNVVPYAETGKSFAGWYDNPDGDGDPIDFSDPNNPYRMPDGPVELYAVWKFDPVDVTFNLDGYNQTTGAKFLDSDKTTELTSTFTAEKPAPAVTWPNNNTAPAKTKFMDLDYGDNITSTVADSRGKLLEAYTPEASGYTFLHWEYVGKDQQVHKFYVSADITEDMALYPVFYKSPVTEANVDIYYKFQKKDGSFYDEVMARTDTVTVGKMKLFTIDPAVDTITVPAGSNIDISDYTLDPAFLFERVTEDWLRNHTGVDGRCKLVFSFVKDANEWDYTVEYCLNLEPVGGGAKEMVPILSLSKHAESAYIFESFYSLPGSMNSGFLFSKVELSGGTLSGDDAISTDPIAIVKRGEANKITVYLEPDVDAFLQGDYTTVYNGLPQGIDEEEFESALPSVGNVLQDTSITGLTAANLKYETPTYAYYVGNSDTPMAGKPTNVGVYRLEITVNLILTVPGTGDSSTTKEYVFWKTPTIGTSTRPGIIYTIERCDVVLASKDVYLFFYENDANRAAYNNRELPAGAGEPTLMARYPTTATDSGVDIQIGHGDASMANAIKSHVSVGLSGDAYRTAPSGDYKSEASYTLNAFEFQVSGFTSEQLDNYNFYKKYGRIYLWESLDAYNAYASAELSGNSDG